MFKRTLAWLKTVRAFSDAIQSVIAVVAVATPVAIAVWAYFRGHPALLLVAIALLAVPVAFVALLWKRLRSAKSASRSSTVPELAIIVGQNGPYVETANHNLYNVMKTVSVGVKNVGNSYLTNCKIHFQVRKLETGEPVRWERDGPFSLNQGEERYISLAAYNEALPPHPKGEDWIRPCVPASGNYYWRPPLIPPSGGSVTITAVSAESRPCEVICNLWVIDNKFRWARA